MNRFEPIEFEGLNESDVREEIIALLPRELGYRSGTPNNVIREQSLRYPRKYIGRKKPDRDPILRGSADSILEAQRRVRWTIEAKAPQVVIDEEAIDQSYTYASHPEIRAIYFVICNGKTFQVFQPDLSPTEPPILTVEYAEMNEKFPSIKNLLGPEALLKDHPRQKIDVGIPLGPGLRSVARITNGLICYDNTLNLPALNELQTTIVGGAVKRDENGKMVAFLETLPPTQSLQELSERLRLDRFEMRSESNSLSTDSWNLTHFEYSREITFPAGEKLLDFNTWQPITLECNVRCDSTARAQGFLEGNQFVGEFIAKTDFHNLFPEVTLKARFKVNLA